ncbi:MAG: phosphoglycerate kinase [Candidatus Saccharibacteria bacterium]|nr:phosphoglycerate kinase [Candidatus Saccharibacteria bacterium]
MRTIRDAEIKDKTVLVRVDYNVPLEKGEIVSDLRILASLETIECLLENGAKKIVLISHLGRPEGKADMDLSLSPVAERLRELLPDQHIGFYPLPTSSEERLAEISNNKIDLLENLRFDPREEENSEEFAEELVNFVQPDLFIQDGFAVIHRAHTSTSALPKMLDSYAGLLVEKEIESLNKAVENPEHPLVVIIGGSKVEDKAPLIEKFSGIADKIIIGGKIAADGYESKDEKIYVAEDFDEDGDGNKLDVGPVSTVKIAEILENAKTIVWNGLLGKAEDPAYATSSTVVAEILGEKRDAETIICGGDTTGFVDEIMEEHEDLDYSLISTGGGASLEFLLGKELPGLKVLSD